MKNKIYLFILLLICFALTSCQPALSSTDTSVKKSEMLFDTIVTLEIYGTDDESILEACFDLGTHYEQLLSKTIPDSEVSLINQSGGQPVTISDETADLLQIGLQYGILTDGAFDITIAAAAELWNFTAESPAIPDRNQLADRIGAVDYRSIRLEGNVVTLTNPDTCIDLGGIAKGYIADRIKDYLLEEGVEHALLNLGGDVLAIGSKPDGSSWNIGIQKPFAEQNEVITSSPVNNQAIVTSGSYERYFEAEGQLYHHILSPSDGYPVSSSLTSVTVITDNAVDADCISTACFVMGLDTGLAWIESVKETEAMFITEDGSIFYSSGYPSR